MESIGQVLSHGARSAEPKQEYWLAGHRYGA
jgi:hypothetical protein